MEDEKEESEKENVAKAAKKEKIYTKEQVDKLKFIVVNDRRMKCINYGMKFASCDQLDGCAMFNTHSGRISMYQNLI